MGEAVTDPIYHRGLHLSEEQLLPPEKGCPVCGFSGARPQVILLQDAPAVPLLACRCGCASAGRMPREDVLKDYYSRYYTPADNTSTFDGSDRFSRHLFRVLGVAAQPVIRILDFGGGVDAAISRSLARQFILHGARRIEIALVDYNASCPEDRGDGITVTCYQQLPQNEKFDVVLASAIVEHIPHPRDIILGLFMALQPRGRIYFRTPAMAAIINLASRLGVKIDFTYPAHIHDMGQSFWENILGTLKIENLKLIRSRPSIVETTFSDHPARTVIACLFKAPWFILRNYYSMVGGWEAVFERMPEKRG